MSKPISYDGTFMETLDGFTSDDVVELINELFQRDYPRDSKVTRLATESHLDGEERRSDSVIRIGEKNMYHIEIQSNSDNSIAFRAFEYSYRAAIQHGRTDNASFLELDFPKTIVFYLRSDKSTPHELTVKLNLPDGNIVTYKLPTKRLCEYKPEDLIKRSMVIFAPFYSMLFEEEVEKNPTAVEKMRDVAIFLSDGIKERLEKSEISKKTADFAMNALRVVFKNVLAKAKLNHEKEGEIMEAVERRYNLDINVRYAEGKTEGKTEGMLEIAKNLLGMGDTVEKVSKATGLPREQIEKLCPQ